MNSSCVGANCTDAGEHGAPAEQPALLPRHPACQEPFKLPQAWLAGRHAPLFAQKPLLKTRRRAASPRACAQTHLVATLYLRLSKRSKLGTRGNIAPLKYSRWEAGEDSRSVLEPGGDMEGGQRAAAGGYSTHHGGNPTVHAASPTLGDALQAVHPARGSQPGRGLLSTPACPQPPSGYEDVISLRFPLQSRNAASRCS